MARKAGWQPAALSKVPPKLLKNGRGILRAVWRPINNRPQDGIPPHIGHTFIPTPVRPAHITYRLATRPTFEGGSCYARVANKRRIHNVGPAPLRMAICRS